MQDGWDDSAAPGGAGRSAVLRLRPGFDWRDVQGDVVALDLRRSVYLATNPTGALLWARLAQGATKEDLVDVLVSAFDVARSTAENDIESFLQRLRALDVVAEK